MASVTLAFEGIEWGRTRGRLEPLSCEIDSAFIKKQRDRTDLAGFTIRYLTNILSLSCVIDRFEWKTFLHSPFL